MTKSANHGRNDSLMSTAAPVEQLRYPFRRRRVCGVRGREGGAGTKGNALNVHSCDAFNEALNKGQRKGNALNEALNEGQRLECPQPSAPFAALSTAFLSAPLFPVACRVIVGRCPSCWLASHAAHTSVLQGRLVVIPRRLARGVALGVARGPACMGCCAAISSTRVDAWGGRR